MTYTTLVDLWTNSSTYPILVQSEADGSTYLITAAANNSWFIGQQIQVSNNFGATYIITNPSLMIFSGTEINWAIL